MGWHPSYLAFQDSKGNVGGRADRGMISSASRARVAVADRPIADFDCRLENGLQHIFTLRGDGYACGLTKAAFLSARNVALANIAIIGADASLP